MSPVGFKDTIPEKEGSQIKYVNDHVKFKPDFFALEKLAG